MSKATCLQQQQPQRHDSDQRQTIRLRQRTVHHRECSRQVDLQIHNRPQRQALGGRGAPTSGQDKLTNTHKTKGLRLGVTLLSNDLPRGGDMSCFLRGVCTAVPHSSGHNIGYFHIINCNIGPPIGSNQRW
jgi:hypothetical protein